jgi:hypothetical protein
MPVPILSTTNIANLASLVEDIALTDACDIQRAPRVNDSQGGSSGSYVTVESTMCAIVDDKQPIEQQVAQQTIGKPIKKALLPKGTDIRKNDLLMTNGLTYRVVGLFEPMSYEVVRRVSVTPRV